MLGVRNRRRVHVMAAQILKYFSVIHNFRVRAALFDHPARGALSPPHTSRRWDRQLRDKPRPRFEGCARQPSGQEAHSANLFRKECQGCNEARKPSCPAPQFNLPRRLSPPSHGSADRRLRPACMCCEYTATKTKQRARLPPRVRKT